MDAAAFPRLRVRLTLIVALAIWTLLVWQQQHGGVPSHSFLASDEYPPISNWWGALILPVLTWILGGRVQARLALSSGDPAKRAAEWRTVLLSFTATIAYAVSLGAAFLTGHAEISSTLFQALPVIGILLPIYRAEYVLGFVLGLTYFFGAALPTFIATVVAAVGAILFLGLRPLLARLWRLVRS